MSSVRAISPLALPPIYARSARTAEFGRAPWTPFASSLLHTPAPPYVILRSHVSHAEFLTPQPQSAVPYHPNPIPYPGPPNVDGDADDDSMSQSTKPWNASFLQPDAVTDEARHFRVAEWLDRYDAEDDLPDSMVASSSSASVWSYSGVASTASTSVDSLGLHHVTPFGVMDDCSADVRHSPTQTIYDRMDFAIASESICSHHELSELDITLIPPSSGTLVNWKSPIAPYRAMEDDDDIVRLLGQKRPRDTELDELADRYKRRRMLELRV